MVDAYTGITKSDAMTKYEEYVLKGSSSEMSKSDGVDLNNPTHNNDDEISNKEGE